LAEAVEQHAFSGKEQDLTMELAEMRICADRTLAAVSLLRAI
jgi:hypothetical protein